MPRASKIGIIAALRREIRELVARPEVQRLPVMGRSLPVYVLGDVSITCAGTGRQAAARATEEMIEQFRPELIVSVGFAGAVDPGLCIGGVIVPDTVIEADSGRRFSTMRGEGVLVSTNGIATCEEKTELREKYQALAVDMEASAVAERAGAYAVQFMAIKSISDSAATTLPDFSRFVRKNGEFATLRFLLYTMLHPTLWPELRKLAANTELAAKNLTSALRNSVLDGSHLPAVNSKQAINSR